MSSRRCRFRKGTFLPPTAGHPWLQDLPVSLRHACRPKGVCPRSSTHDQDVGWSCSRHRSRNHPHQCSHCASRDKKGLPPEHLYLNTCRSPLASFQRYLVTTVLPSVPERQTLPIGPRRLSIPLRVLDASQARPSFCLD